MLVFSCQTLLAGARESTCTYTVGVQSCLRGTKPTNQPKGKLTPFFLRKYRKLQPSESDSRFLWALLAQPKHVGQVLADSRPLAAVSRCRLRARAGCGAAAPAAACGRWGGLSGGHKAGLARQPGSGRGHGALFA